ncbi:hypothetical protein FOL47_002425 [Perkinsus chesapeaki]|uniref:Uncharacterized protein n=1 Tax=Perkinsus chesapeaki TaxID=330153 RepID=A0A7J6KPY2_PERCH|nr:hypothetical protein FOL47_002425 [Perkinsus chesapeaki]
MANSAKSRGLTGLDANLLPSSTTMESILRSMSGATIALLEAPIHQFVDLHARPTLSSISTKTDLKKPSDLQSDYLRLGNFSAGLMRWTCTAALPTDGSADALALSSLLDHIAASLRYADPLGPRRGGTFRLW